MYDIIIGDDSHVTWHTPDLKVQIAFIYRLNKQRTVLKIITFLLVVGRCRPATDEYRIELVSWCECITWWTFCSKRWLKKASWLIGDRRWFMCVCLIWERDPFTKLERGCTGVYTKGVQMRFCLIWEERWVNLEFWACRLKTN